MSPPRISAEQCCFFTASRGGAAIQAACEGQRDSHALPANDPTKHGRVWDGPSLGDEDRLLFNPPSNSGILFGNISSDEAVPAHLDYVQATDLATSLRKGRAIAKTVEHLMAVLHAYRITNVMIKMIEEIPIMDGSALEFCNMVEEAGIEEQEERVDELVIDRRVEIVRKNKSLVIEPSEVFSVHYFLDYPPPIGSRRSTSSWRTRRRSSVRLPQPVRSDFSGC